MTDQTSPGQSYVPLNRACEAYRSVKVRCLPGTLGPSPICQRCIKSNRTCVFAPPQRKTQRRRTVTRVPELEKEMQAVRALLDRTYHRPQEVSNEETTNATSSLTSSSPGHTSSGQSSAAATGLPISASQPVTGLTTRPVNVNTTTAKLDVVDRGIFSMECH